MTKNNSCWNCNAPINDAAFCPECSRIQPLASDENYFSFLGYPGKQLSLDQAELEQRFYKLSRQLHPDYFNQSSAREQSLSLERSSFLNDAYRALKDPIRRAEYIIELAGAELGKAQAPPDLLLEMFELNEQLDDWRSAKRQNESSTLDKLRPQLRKTLVNLEQRQQELLTQLQRLFESWDSVQDRPDSGSQNQNILKQISDVLSQHSYVRNLVRDLQEELE